nr:PREDICTED: uncharacterized protein LOC107076967 [Lepisosteus oculatus]
MECNAFAVASSASCNLHRSLVFFDLETTGLGPRCDIVQLSAVSGDHTFNVYMVPRRPILRGASVVTGFTVRRRQLWLHSQALPTITHWEALISFVAFLRMLNRPFLAGHNIRRFDCPVLLKVLDEFHLREDFQQATSGFVDTLLLARELFRHSSIRSYRQEHLVRACLGTSYQAHNALEDVKALQRLFRAWAPRSEQVVRHTFTLSQVGTRNSRWPLI